MKRVSWLILLGLLLGCGAEAAPTATAVPPTVAQSEIAVEEASAPTATAVPILPTNTRPPTVIPPTPQPLATRRPTALPATAVPPEVPAFVWLPYATGNFGQPVLMLKNSELAYQPLPVAAEIFFDYQAGWLAYGSKFWGATTNQQSVTDLHLYNFASGIDQLWEEANIGRAALSPVPAASGQPVVAVAKHNGRGFDLVLKLEPDIELLLVEDIDPYFSWSPDGRFLAYLRDNELFVTSADVDSGAPPIASGVYANSGWIGDAPLWLGNSGYLLYAAAPFTIVAADGSETITPVGEDGAALPGTRPFAMLYSSATSQLIAESEGMFGSSVVVYQFGDGFGTAVVTQQIDDAQLAGWFEAGESVVIVSGGEPTILPLTPQE